MTSVRRQFVAEDGPAQETCDASAVRFGQHEVGVSAQGGDGIGHGDADLAGIEQSVVVLGVADADCAVARDTEIAQDVDEAGPLGDTGRCDHQSLAVAHDLTVESETRHLFENDVIVVGVRVEEYAAATQRDVAPSQCGLEFGRDGRSRDTHTRGARDYGTVLGNDSVESLLDIRQQIAQVIEDPTGAQDHTHTRVAQFADCGQHGFVGVSDGQSAVIVDGNGAERRWHRMRRSGNWAVRVRGVQQSCGSRDDGNF
ncbi:MAG TPA: hypothetical protein VMM79_19345 [Longimicrobiales bacterium]|nr:hypothetical protein [Longimicrobiales bacterium]